MSSLLSAYPLVTTPAVRACRDFYVSHFGFTVGFTASWFVWLTRQSADGASVLNLAFMHPDHPSAPPGPEVFEGRGQLLTLQVTDAATESARLAAAGVEIVYSLRDEPWGQRRFQLRDPAGMLIDVVEQTEPQAGWWDRHGGGDDPL